MGMGTYDSRWVVGSGVESKPHPGYRVLFVFCDVCVDFVPSASSYQ